MKNIRRLTAAVLAAALLITLLPAGALAAGSYYDYPYSAIAYMEIEFKCGCTTTGTGVMVAPNGLITAGHNLNCHVHNRPAKTLSFWFGYVNKSNYRYRYMKGQCSFTYYCDFSRGYNSANDIGYVVFPKEIGQNTGWLATSFSADASEFDRGGEFVSVDGYAYGSLKSCYTVAEEYGATQVSIEDVSWGMDAGSPFIRSGEGEPTVVRGVLTSRSNSRWYGRVLTKNIYRDMISSGVRFT